MKEATARIKINKLLEKSNWRFLDDENGKANIELESHIKGSKLGDNFEHTKDGFVDYLLMDENDFPLCVLEAKQEEKHPLDGKEQARKYAQRMKARYILLSNGNLHYFWDTDHGNPIPISTFPTPESLTSRISYKPDHTLLVNEAITTDYLIQSNFPGHEKDPSWIDESKREDFIETNKITFLRPYQIEAIKALQNAVSEGKNRFLFEMATGTGKTTTCAAIVRMYLKTGNAKRVLFLVDRLELESQAEKAFKRLLSPDYQTVIYKEKKNDWKKAEVVVTTIQSIMFENKYLKRFSPTDFDLIISDEAHRTINGEGASRQVFDYFIGHKLGLTATPKDYLKHVNLREDDPREIERRTLLSTYKTFGCENGKPTYSYSLLDGVRDGYLINPTVLDCRTEITTQLLADEGYKVTIDYADDESGVQQTEKIYKHTDFEKKFFSDKTNIEFALTFMQHALKDPISNEIGKTLVFCVSQKHARKVTTILNELAERLYPGKYNSDFAVQVTSSVTGAQDATVAFANNNLNGHTRWLEGYKSSRTRVCVTVGMMTTGYDCTDVLNILLMRPIFSPTDFIQIKGRGTRKNKFVLGQEKVQKHKYLLFDFFGNCEFFEEDFDYDQQLELPKVNGKIIITDPPGTGGVTGQLDEYYSFIQDKLASMETIELGNEGMRIDRELFKHSFEQHLEEMKKSPTMQDLIFSGDIEQIEALVKERVLDKPDEYLTIEKLRTAYPSDRKVSLREIIEHVLFGKKIASLEEKATEYFERYKLSTKLPAETFYYIREFFIRYVIDPQFRNAVDTDSYGAYGSDPWMREVIRETGPQRSSIQQYCKENVPLQQFT